MFLPIGDEPNPRGTPYVTYGLILVNVAIFLLVTLPLSQSAVDLSDPLLPAYLRFKSLQIPGVAPHALLNGVSAYDLFVFEHGFKPGAPGIASLFTSLFLHGTFLHLLGNMLFLWIFGDNVEARLGHLGYLLAYLVCGVAATMFFALFAGQAMVPLVGASGAIFGILGCYFLWFRQNRVRVLVFLVVFIDVWRVPARWVLGSYVLLYNVLPFLTGANSAVAHGAHIGGFLAGLGIAYLVPAAKTPSATFDPSKVPFESLATGFRRHVLMSDFSNAAEMYAQMSLAERHELYDEDVLGLAQGLGQQGQAALALAILQRFLATRHNTPDRARAHVYAGMLLLERLHKAAAARQHFLAALESTPSTDLAVAARRGLSLCDQMLSQRLN